MRESDAGKETQQRIIDYAIDHFWRYGYSGITIDEIVSELRMSKATFYSFFKSKEDLAVEAARSYYEKEKRYSFGPIGSSKALVEELKGLMRHLVTILERVDPRARRDIRTSVPKAWVKMQLFQHEAVSELMDRLLSLGQQNGAIKPDTNIKILGALLSLSVESIINSEALASLGMNQMEALQSFVDVFFGGLLAVPAAGAV
jgi:TetR/AcrR family transcriptional regulator